MHTRLIIFNLLIFVCKTAACQTKLEPKAMQADIATMKAVWENIHPGLYRYNDSESINHYFSILEKKAQQTQTLRDFYIQISQFNTQLHCGHTYVSYYNNNDDIKTELFSPIVLPILFIAQDDRLIITHNLTSHSELKPGTEIKAINGVSVKTIIDSLLSVSKADGLNAHQKKLSNISIYPNQILLEDYCLFDIYYPLFFKENIHNISYHIQLNRGKKLDVQGITKAERWVEYEKKYGVLPKDQETWNLKECTPQTVKLQIGDFATYNWDFDYRHYLDSIFSYIKEKKYTNLIIDIRQNEGGSDDARDALLSYLISSPLPQPDAIRRLYRYTSITDSLKPYLNTWDDSFLADKIGFTPTSDGYFESPMSTLEKPNINPATNHFNGKIFLITDATNSSTTFILAEYFQKHHLGIIIGETTGGSKQGINGGEIVFFSLPNSKIEMDLPLLWQRPLTDQKDEGVHPDYSIITTSKHIAKGSDAQLDYILKHLVRK